MIIVHAHMQIQPDQQHVFLDEIQTLIQATRMEVGNINFELMQSTEQNNRYTMMGLWKDLEATSSHTSSEHFTSFFQKAPTFMAAPIELEVFSGEPVQL